jgi:uncharacterized membrane protein YhaH (DUF805 family)
VSVQTQTRTRSQEESPQVTGRTRRSTAYAVVMTLCAIAIVLQGLWAGLFLQHGHDSATGQSWLHVHARGGEVAIGLAAVAAIIAFFRMFRRYALWFWTGVLVVLLAGEAYVGGQITEHEQHNLLPVHVPLAMAILTLAAWLTVVAWRRPRVLTTAD